MPNSENPTQLTTEESIEKKSEFDFEILLKPYREGGTEITPVERTSALIIDWLMNKKKFPKEIIGSALMICFDELKKGTISFAGDGSWGSKGHQLDRYILDTCQRLTDVKQTSEAWAFAEHLRKALSKKPSVWKRMFGRTSNAA